MINKLFFKSSQFWESVGFALYASIIAYLILELIHIVPFSSGEISFFVFGSAFISCLILYPKNKVISPNEIFKWCAATAFFSPLPLWLPIINLVYTSLPSVFGFFTYTYIVRPLAIADIKAWPELKQAAKEIYTLGKNYLTTRRWTEIFCFSLQAATIVYLIMLLAASYSVSLHIPVIAYVSVFLASVLMLSKKTNLTTKQLLLKNLIIGIIASFIAAFIYNSSIGQLIYNFGETINSSFGYGTRFCLFALPIMLVNFSFYVFVTKPILKKAKLRSY